MDASSEIRRGGESATPSETTEPPQQAKASTLELAQSSGQSVRVLLGLKLAPLGLVPGQDRLLQALAERGPITVSALADVLNVRPSTASKALDRLQERDLAFRTGDADDARKTVVDLTDAGRSACLDVQALCQGIEDDIHSTLTADEIKTMKAGLALFDRAVARRLKRLR